jgi:hypothetical protein
VNWRVALAAKRCHQCLDSLWSSNAIDHQGGPLGSERLCHAKTNPTGGPRDEDHPAPELVICFEILHLKMIVCQRNEFKGSRSSTARHQLQEPIRGAPDGGA